MLVSKNAKICITPNAKPKLALPPKRTPNASQWNKGCVGSPGVGTCVGHVHFMLFVSISLNAFFSGIWALASRNQDDLYLQAFAW